MKNEELSLQGACVLLVDDQPSNLDVVCSILADKEYQISVAKDGQTALALAPSLNPELILLDVGLPDLDGFEVCRRLQANPTTRTIPVVFLTARVDRADVATGFQAGGVDYIAKPIQADELRTRVDTHLRLNRLNSYIPSKSYVMKPDSSTQQPLNWAAAQLSLIRQALQETHGDVAQAARLLGIDRDQIDRQLALESEAPNS